MTDKNELAVAMKAGMRFLASGVTVVATRDQANIAHAMTVTSTTSLSDDPASLLVCLHSDSTTCKSLTVGGEFSLNILNDEQADISQRCAFVPEDEYRLKLGAWKDIGLKNIPYLSDGLVSFICEIKKTVVYGTHIIIIGDITEVVFNDKSSEALLYYDGEYIGLGEKIKK